MEEAARESGAARWASGAEVPESGAGVGSESVAALRGEKERHLSELCVTLISSVRKMTQH